MKSYLNKTFVIRDPQSRIRRDDDLLAFVMENNTPKSIPVNTEIQVTDARFVRDILFVRADGWGWTTASNLKNEFLNQTISAIEPAGNDSKGANAAWDRGRFLRQITLIQIVGANKTVKFVSSEVIDFYLALVNAAEADGVLLGLKSGFRTYPEQTHLYDGYRRGLPRFNLAAKPGFSNHQDGYAYDFTISSYEGNPLYDWLKRNGPRFGFVRAVNKEPWHWEYRPQVAATGVYKLPNVTK